MATQAETSVPWSKKKLDFRMRSSRYYFRLQSESSPSPSEDDTESVYSLQDKETDIVRDSSDSDKSSSENEDYVEIEYELASLSDGEEHELIVSGDSDVEHDIVLATAAAFYDSSFENWVTDGEESDNSSLEDSSFNRIECWTCLQCKSENNVFRYCEKCFQDRKSFFPPRPRGRKKNNRKAPNSPVKLDTLRSCLSGLSQDSGIGSSQECPPLSLDQIVVPDYLQEESSSKICLAKGEERVTEGESREPLPSTSQQNLTGERNNSQISMRHKRVLDNLANRKRQLSESSLSESEAKRPKRFKHQKASSDHEITDAPPKTTAAGSYSFESGVGSSSYTSESKISSTKSYELTPSPPEQTSTAEVGGGGLSKEMCMFCNTTPIDSTFLHGRIGHMCCCYKCAMRTWKTIKRCPICNRRVNNVIKIYKL